MKRKEELEKILKKYPEVPRTTVEGLYLCGPSTYPGVGVVGAARASVQVVMEDLGIDFVDVLKK